MGSALTEYGLLIAVVALGLFAVLVGFRDAVGNLTHQTSVTITRHSGGGYGRGGGGGVRHGGGGESSPDNPPEPENGDSGSTSVGSGMTVAGAR
jgi:Flp pilus assembly pilin Flp